MCLIKKNSRLKKGFRSKEYVDDERFGSANMAINSPAYFIKDVIILGCGGRDVIKKEEIRIESAELKVAAYKAEQILKNNFQGNLSEMNSNQLQGLGLDVGVNNVYMEAEKRAFSIFLSLASTELGGRLQTISHTIWQLSKQNYIFEQNFSRLWILIFHLNDADKEEVASWAVFLDAVSNECKLDFGSPRQCFYRVLFAKAEKLGALHGLDSPKYLEALTAYDDLVTNNCYFPLIYA